VRVLTFDDLRAVNAERCARWHPGFPALLFSLIVLAVAVGEASARLKRWTTPPDPERQALDELERIWRLPAFRDRRVP
jgi:hypothetical protein